MVLLLQHLLVVLLCIVACGGAWGREDLYAVLGLTESASARDITRAYRKLALKFHPDKVAPEDKEDAEKAFTEIVNAYEVLKDEELRAAYDKGELSEDETHRYSDFASASRAAGMASVEDTPLAWLGVLGVTALAVVPALYLTLTRSKTTKKKKRPASASLDSALAKARAAGEAEAAAAATAAQEAATARAAVVAKGRQQKAATRAKAEAAAAATAVKQAAFDAAAAAEAAARRQSGAPAVSTTASDFTVTPEALHRLAKALAKFPGGTRHRFDKIAEFVGGGCEAGDVSSMIRSLRAGGSGGIKKASAVLVQPPVVTAPPAPEAWDAEAQAALEAALRSVPARFSPPPGADRGEAKALVSAKWKWVASQPGLEARSARQCLARFRECAAAVKAGKQ